MNKQERMAELHTQLTKLKAFGPDNAKAGICSNIADLLYRREFSDADEVVICRDLHTLASEWPKGSGCRVYVVPHPQDLSRTGRAQHAAMSAYLSGSAGDLWSREPGSYGALRWELLDWLIEQTRS